MKVFPTYFTDSNVGFWTLLSTETSLKKSGFRAKTRKRDGSHFVDIVIEHVSFRATLIKKCLLDGGTKKHSKTRVFWCFRACAEVVFLGVWDTLPAPRENYRG